MRIINTDTAGKKRQQHLRTMAEMVKRLPEVSVEEGLDMGAYMLSLLSEIMEGIEKSCESWDFRGYYMKSEQLRQRWLWVPRSHQNIEEALESKNVDELILAILSVYPHIQHITVKKTTRDPSLWSGKFNEWWAAKTPTS